MSRSIFAAAFALAALAAACSPQAAKPADAPTDVAASGCADDGVRLPGTGICAGRAANYLENPPPNPPAPEGCTWTFNEAVLADTEALIYRAMTCKGVTTKLAFSAGARSASIDYEK